MTRLKPLRCAVMTAIFLVTGDLSAGAQVSITPEEVVRVYYCHNLATLTVRVLPNEVEVIVMERKTRLTKVASSSSVLYSNGTATLSGLEEYVRFEDSGANYWCRNSPSEAPWQAARLRGIEFRAVGDDPEWSLEIDSGVAAEFSTGRGTARIVTAFPSAELDSKSGRMKLAIRSGSHTLAVIAEPRICHREAP